MLNSKNIFRNQISHKVNINLYIFHLGMLDRIKTHLKLSHKRSGGCDRLNFSSWSKDSSHMDFAATIAKALYPASVDDRAITRCFLEL
jgi:hypothetical protein